MFICQLFVVSVFFLSLCVVHLLSAGKPDQRYANCPMNKHHHLWHMNDNDIKTLALVSKRVTQQN